MNRNRFLVIQNQTLPPSMHHMWKEITDIVCKTLNEISEGTKIRWKVPILQGNYISHDLLGFSLAILFSQPFHKIWWPFGEVSLLNLQYELDPFYRFGVLFNMARLTVDDVRVSFAKGPWWLRLFNGYDLTTWLVVLNLGCTGLLVSWVMKYADNIVKVQFYSLLNVMLRATLYTRAWGSMTVQI